MRENGSDTKGMSAAVWIIVLVCLSAIIISLAFGTAYAGIQAARTTAAKASLGEIETVFALAEVQAQEAGLTPPAGSYQNLLKSYDSDTASLTPYERYVLETMLEMFGEQRDFDFAVTRYEDAAGLHTYVYYFPTRGQTDMRTDRYYVMIDNSFEEKNG